MQIIADSIAPNVEEIMEQNNVIKVLHFCAALFSIIT